MTIKPKALLAITIDIQHNIAITTDKNLSAY